MSEGAKTHLNAHIPGLCLRVYKTAIFSQPWGIPWHLHIVFGLSQNSKFVFGGVFPSLNMVTLKITVEECVWVRF